MPLFKPKISRLIAQLSLEVEAEAKRAASALDGLLYPHYGPGPRVISSAEAQRIKDSHYKTIRGSKAVDALMDAARHGKEFARAYSVGVLGSIGDRRALQHVVDGLADVSPKVRLAATISLLHFQEPSTVPHLIQSLGDPDEDVCRSAAMVLGCFRVVDAVVPLMALYESGNSEAKAAALHALGSIGDPRSLPLARDALQDKVRKVRDAAKSALAAYDLRRRHAN